MFIELETWSHDDEGNVVKGPTLIDVDDISCVQKEAIWSTYSVETNRTENQPCSRIQLAGGSTYSIDRTHYDNLKNILLNKPKQFATAREGKL